MKVLKSLFFKISLRSRIWSLQIKYSLKKIVYRCVLKFSLLTNIQTENVFTGKVNKGKMKKTF